MTTATSVLMRPDPKGRSFAFAMLLHGSLVGVFVAYSLIHFDTEKFGDPNAGGANVGVEVADKIPIPHSGPQNPVAHDTESEAAEAPPQKVEKVKQEVLSPDAVKLNLHKEPKKAQAKEESVRKHLKSYDELEKNQLTSRTPQAVSSPLFSQLPGSGRVGAGANTTLGTRFSAYGALIQDLIARNWKTDDVRAQSGPLVVARFDLMKDGSVRNLTIVQPSGIQTLDFSVRRAIEGVRFPPLPPGFDHSFATCEFTFELKK